MHPESQCRHPIYSVAKHRTNTAADENDEKDKGPMGHGTALLPVVIW
jgi:hypothetical protein